MTGFLKQSTASQGRTICAFIDDTDFKSVENGLTIANTDIKLKKNGATAVNKNSGGATSDVNGMYGLTFDATDTNTVGELKVGILVSGALVVWDTFTVLEEAVYDALFGSAAPGYLQPTTAGRTLDVSAGGEAGLDWANVGGQGTSVDLSATAFNLVDTCAVNSDMVGTNGALLAANINLTAGALDVVTTLTNLPAITANWLTAAGIAASALNNKGNWNVGKSGYSLTQTFPTNFADFAIAVTSGEVTVGTNNDKADYNVASLDTNAITAASITSGALDGKGNWNIGKTGYSLTQGFPSNFAAMGISVGGAIDNVTDLTNLTAIPANWLTAAGIAASALNGKGDWNINKTSYSLSAAGNIAIVDLVLPPTNTAFSNIPFVFVDSTDHVTPVTGATGMSVERSIDSAAYAAGTGTLAEVSDGTYQYDASAADVNGKIITFKFSATGGTPNAPDDRYVTVVMSV